jgi:hypothetical protein
MSGFVPVVRSSSAMGIHYAGTVGQDIAAVYLEGRRE